MPSLLLCSYLGDVLPLFTQAKESRLVKTRSIIDYRLQMTIGCTSSTVSYNADGYVQCSVGEHRPSKRLGNCEVARLGK
ncbi:hypothetical protein GGR50DRAFT_643017 [Xylaria sp. CBS 124048]|nr:hypothetical protein GGR50DRAFT_643017 [Xylaria sp. CBS 124048]